MLDKISKYLLVLSMLVSIFFYFKYQNAEIKRLRENEKSFNIQRDIDSIKASADKNISLIRKDFKNEKKDKNITDGNYSYTFDWMFHNSQ